jgi:hypothetical protein
MYAGRKLDLKISLNDEEWMKQLTHSAKPYLATWFIIEVFRDLRLSEFARLVDSYQENDLDNWEQVEPPAISYYKGSYT